MTIEILAPLYVDSIPTLNEWLAECGMPQRDIDASDMITDLGEEMGAGFLVTMEQAVESGRDPDPNDKGYHDAVAFLARAYYARLTYADGKRLVWITRPYIHRRLDPVTRNWICGVSSKWYLETLPLDP